MKTDYRYSKIIFICKTKFLVKVHIMTHCIKSFHKISTPGEIMVFYSVLLIKKTPDDLNFHKKFRFTNKYDFNKSSLF